MCRGGGRLLGTPPPIRVRIPLKSTVLLLKLIEKNRNMQKEAVDGQSKIRVHAPVNNSVQCDM